MALSPTKEAQVKAYIIQGLTTKEIESLTNVGKSKIYVIKKELEQHALDNQANDLARTSPAILASVAKGIRDRAPMALEQEVEKLLDASLSLQKLECNFHESFNKVLEKSERILEREDLTIIEWQIVTNTLASAFKDIYNSKGTTINVANASNVAGSQSSLSMFQSRMKA